MNNEQVYSYTVFASPSQVVVFLNEFKHKIKPISITHDGECFVVFYYRVFPQE